VAPIARRDGAARTAPVWPWWALTVGFGAAGAALGWSIYAAAV